MRPLLILLAASLVALAFSLSSAGRSSRAAAPSLSPARALETPVLSTRCGFPHALHLDRFEDGSAQVRCRGRLLVRISVPG
jgi:hypothetical protein